MAHPEHLALLNKGVDHWNSWRAHTALNEVRINKNGIDPATLTSADLAQADLSGANLVGAKLIGANFDRTNLIGADLSHADLTGADLTSANLRVAKFSSAECFKAYFNQADFNEAKFIGANLREAEIVGSDLTDADFSNADFTDADVTGSTFYSTILKGAICVRAWFGSTIFADVNLSETRGLGHACFGGPCTLGIDTLYASQGQIPEDFLRGIGVPDTLIAFAKSLATNPIQFYSCFISYSTRDQDFADRLYADLQAKGVRCWFAPHDAQRGRKLHEQIDEAIRVHEKLLLILSSFSINSEWVKTEIAKARKRETRDKVQVLFPVSLVAFDPTIRDWQCFDADTGSDSARAIREFYIPDFSNWKDHDSYQREFGLLLRDLQSRRTLTTKY